MPLSTSLADHTGTASTITATTTTTSTSTTTTTTYYKCSIRATSSTMAHLSNPFFSISIAATILSTPPTIKSSPSSFLALPVVLCHVG